ncbi:acyltransferase [Flavobacterium sp. GT3R68]|uniref:acyltransferase n=1 Tax=Flavobacterium sp. GT3R68 TaxID=2594437 RepID=UPI000F871339|nr:acyltransferase [Flavobacterium sp. GT3R68]RTY92352.1 acyltransferase [Flavobacterium sp. GSN2]TRW92266.1 acyltransferase [Flavobacterium sp. GT3R68]
MSIIDRIKIFCFVTFRIKKYQWLSDCKRVSGLPNSYHPLLLTGKGKITFGNNVQIGVSTSPNYYSHYTYFEAREEYSEIIIGNNVAINNAFSVVAFSKITIGDHVLIGVNCSIIDNDGHHLAFDKRNSGNPKTDEVHIHENVFLGSNVSILKGVTIGKNSVIGYGSVVTKSIPENVIAAGNPAVVIRNL